MKTIQQFNLLGIDVGPVVSFFGGDLQDIGSLIQDGAGNAVAVLERRDACSISLRQCREMNYKSAALLRGAG